MNHPCFNAGAHGRFGRIHLPVAPLCNIKCGYCDRRHSCVNESRPGVAAKVVSPDEACRLAQKACDHLDCLTVAGIAGPGDPLANPDATLETLRLVHDALPQLILCLSTNGLRLPEYADDLASLGVSHITVTVNAVDPAIGARIYESVSLPAGLLGGQAAAELLLARQLEGITAAKSCGLTLKINMVIVPGVNADHAGHVAAKAAELGADLMNCIPLVPVEKTRLGHIPEPEPALMARVRESAAEWLPQMRHCSRCRADAMGMLGSGHVIGDLDDATCLKEIKFARRASDKHQAGI